LVRIAGWTPEQDPNLKDKIHFADEIIQVNGADIRSIQQLHLLYPTVTPGTPIELKILSIPQGSIYSMQRPINPRRDMGIILRKKKNEISLIEERSLAYQMQIPNRIEPYIYGTKDVSVVITEVDGLPLNPFDRNEQFYSRLEQIKPHEQFYLIVHPNDFFKLIKQQLKLMKNFKRFIHDS